MKSLIYALSFAGMFILFAMANVSNAQTWSTSDGGVTVYKTNSSGNVGIGITNPAQKLHVYNGSGVSNFQLEGTYAGTGTAGISNFYLKNTAGGAMFGFFFKKEAGVTFVVQSAFDGTNWIAYNKLNYGTKELEYKEGLVDIKFSNTGKILMMNPGNIGIGILNPSSKLAVNGNITCKEVEVLLTGWSDFVFDDQYNLPSLTEVGSFIKANKHLPGVPSSEEVLKNGIKLGDMNAILVQKIEEITLYMIRLQNENEALKARIVALENK
jgi:hypothetical protein